jgi:hypothetical protein
VARHPVHRQVVTSTEEGLLYHDQHSKQVRPVTGCRAWDLSIFDVDQPQASLPFDA